MKVKIPVNRSIGSSGWVGQAGFTVTEIMVASVIFLFVIGGVMTTHYFGLSMYGMTQERLGASDATRKAVNLLTTEIRSALTLKIGAGTQSSFTEIAINTPQLGNSIQIYPTTDTNVFIRYNRDSTDNKLKRLTNAPSTPKVIAEAINNASVFTCQDFRGGTITNRSGNYVLDVQLQFYELQGSRVAIGPGKYYNSYKLQTKVTLRGDQ